ncbi:hypothetical protein D3C80_1923680 [compost metagenome]
MMLAIPQGQNSYEALNVSSDLVLKYSKDWLAKYKINMNPIVQKKKYAYRLIIRTPPNLNLINPYPFHFFGNFNMVYFYCLHEYFYGAD